MSFEGLEFDLVEQLVEAVQPVCWDDRRVVEQRLFALDVILRPERDPAQQRVGSLLLCGTVGGVGIGHTGLLRHSNVLVRAVTAIRWDESLDGTACVSTCWSRWPTYT